ncbi:MAG: NirF protein [Alphaproteobacteria bacterium]|nr:MAG: NirF protein [Alphaproteobacteria bacterium]
MKNIAIIGIVLSVASCSTIKSSNDNEKIYIVERERESLSVVKDQKEYKTIKDLGNLNHATMKFKNGYAYVLARNGFISKIDTSTDLLVKKVKIGKSGIGITFTDSQVVVVNYDPNSVVILDLDLNVQKVIETSSRNVGVKLWNNLLVFSLMDKNEIWVLDTKDDFKIVRKIEAVGNLPFDALIKENLYIVGFFNEGGVGVLDLKDFTYKKISLNNPSDNSTYKVPHFGYWGLVGDMAIVPMVTSNKLLVIDLKDIKRLSEIELIGRPVFASVSPDKKTLVVSYSGDKEDYISVIDTKSLTNKLDFKAGQRIMHFRFSTDGNYLYASSYFENKMHIFETNSWKKVATVAVGTPSGIFIKEQE